MRDRDGKKKPPPDITLRVRKTDHVIYACPWMAADEMPVLELIT